jgi:hypothetical protein
VEASGKEMRGAGTASATVRASLEPEASGDGTRVSMHTTMNVTGRPAQFGRGVIVEVGGKLVDQFAQNLAKQITGDDKQVTGDNPNGTQAAVAEATAPEAGAAAGDAATASATGTGTGTEAPAPVSTAPAPPAQQEESLNLVKLVGPAILKRVVPVAIAAAGLALLGRRLRRVFRQRAKD